MLVELAVQDFALIERLTLTFAPSMNVITGETGAGKSILVGALGAVLGSRTGPDMVRTGADRAIVEARFRLGADHPALAMIRDFGGEPDGDEIILRREIVADGRTRVWVGGASVPVRTLRDIGERLVDFHGQHEHQLLLAPPEHGALLDGFAGDENLLARVRERAQSLARLRDERRALVDRQRETAMRRDTIEFERKELAEIDPRPDEYDALLAEVKVLENVERLGTLLTGLAHLLSEADDAIVARLGSGRKALHEAMEIDTTLGEDVAEQYEEMLVLAQELATRFGDRVAAIEADPQRLEQLQERIALLRRLMRRYGSLDDAIRRRDDLQRVMEDDAGMADRIAGVEAEIVAEHGRFAAAVTELSRARAKAADRMGREVTKSLGALGMERARFSVELARTPAAAIDPVESDAVLLDGESVAAGSGGAEAIEFLIAPNLGEPLRPLVRIASGGEISRAMLAIKSVIAAHDPVATMVFDEIDQGVSGRIAQAVGERMRELARHRQIVAITHLPQIAACADAHIVVRKREERKRTVTEARVLDREERTRALAELIGGAEVTETAIDHARAMLEEHR